MTDFKIAGQNLSMEMDELLARLSNEFALSPEASTALIDGNISDADEASQVLNDPMLQKNEKDLIKMAYAFKQAFPQTDLKIPTLFSKETNSTLRMSGTTYMTLEVFTDEFIKKHYDPQDNLKIIEDYYNGNLELIFKTTFNFDLERLTNRNPEMADYINTLHIEAAQELIRSPGMISKLSDSALLRWHDAVVKNLYSPEPMEYINIEPTNHNPYPYKIPMVQAGRVYLRNNWDNAIETKLAEEIQKRSKNI